MSKPKGEVWGWGRQKVPAHEYRSEDLEAIASKAPIARGLGRAYGDAAAPPAANPQVVDTRLADRFLDFDPEKGTFRAEAGLSLWDFNHHFWPKGFAMPVSPGTQYVTLGGMVAADVHGKNHHLAGTIGEHLLALRVYTSGRGVVECSPRENEDLFWASVGGMGLTGTILEVTLQLERAPSLWIDSWSRRYDDLESLAGALQEAAEDWPFTAAWFDGLRSKKRGVLLCGRWAEKPPSGSGPLPQDPFTVPIDAPAFLINPLSIRIFNWLYFRRHWRREQRSLVHPQSFYYPLDVLQDWNRLYGSRGMVQYQCVIPAVAGIGAVMEFMEKLRSLGGNPYLIVLKDFGEEGRGLLSFPQKGLTLALDLAMGGKTQGIVNGLNAWLREKGGRIYLAKDALTRPEDFRALEPRLEAFLEVKRKWDPEDRFRSRLSERLGLHGISGPS